MDATLTVSNILNRTSTSLKSYGLKLNDKCDFKERANHYYINTSEIQLNLIIESLNSYNDIISCGPAREESELNINKSHLRRFLSKFDLKLDQRVFNAIESNHIIEVYSKNHQQIFRSVNFFKFSSYSIEALTFVPWDQLFHRDAKDFETLFNCANVVIDNELPLLSPKNTSHILTESKTNKKFKYMLHRIGCLFDIETDGVMGYITLINISESPNIQLLH